MAGPPRAHSGVKKDPIARLVRRLADRRWAASFHSQSVSWGCREAASAQGPPNATERRVCKSRGRCCCSGTPTQVKSGIWPHHPHMRCSSSSWLGARSPLREVVRDVPPCPLPISNQGYSYKPHTWGTDPTLSHLPHAYHTRPCVTILTMCVFFSKNCAQRTQIKIPLSLLTRCGELEEGCRFARR